MCTDEVHVVKGKHPHTSVDQYSMWGSSAVGHIAGPQDSSLMELIRCNYYM